MPVAIRPVHRDREVEDLMTRFILTSKSWMSHVVFPIVKWSLNHWIRLGLDTGAVVVGKIGDNLRMDHTAVGDTTNLASRLRTLAEPGQIWVGETTEKAAESYSCLQPLGDLTVKVKAESVRPYRVDDSRGAHSRLEAATECEALCSLLLGLSQRQPLVLFLED